MEKKLQVFISSTYTDLIDERQAAVKAVLDAGHIPAGMELFKAGNQSQLETIYKWIDNSDVYMLILGGRYGTIEEQSGKSYTHLEYEYAIKQNKPIFSAVLSDEFLSCKCEKNNQCEIIEQDHQEQYGKFKHIVLTRTVRHVNNIEGIQLTIHTTLHELIEEKQLIGWVRGDSFDSNQNLLAQLNDLNQEVKQLKNENLLLKDELNNFTQSFQSELAFEGEKLSIEGEYSIPPSGGSRGRKEKYSAEITWDTLFLLWAPYLMNTGTRYKAKNELEKVYCSH